ncbi:MAG: hypothetical protein RUMPE_00491 [Eubacteriales bacterium SKADARSKE-1]|nr:hypothetical protein [Eubacteriales bacterium SKADARSKE-1]
MEKSNAYYYKVVEKMDIKDFNKQTKTKKHECLFDGDKHSGHFEEAYFDRSLTGWIELIENPKLYKAVKDLPVEDQIFISYIVKEGKTQRDLAKVYKMSQVKVCRNFEKIVEKIRVNL